MAVMQKDLSSALRTQFKNFLPSKGVNATVLLNKGWQQDLRLQRCCEPSAYRVRLLEQLDTLLKRCSLKIFRSIPVQAMDDSLIVSKSSLIEPEKNNAFSKSEIETQMQRQEEKVDMCEAVDAGLVVTESSGTNPDKQDTSSSSGNSNTQAHTEQSEPNYDTHLLETIDSNTTPTSTNMCHREKMFDQDALLNVEFSKQKTMEYPEFHEFFVINDLKAQLQAKTILICDLKNQIKSVKEASNEAKVKNDIDTKPNAFKSERPRISRPRFATQVDEKNDLSKTVIPYYLPKVRESAAAKTSSEDARKMTQDKTRIPIIGYGLYRATLHSYPKIRNNNPVEPKNHTHKPGRQICMIGQCFLSNKVFTIVHGNNHTPRSYLRWKPTGRIFKTVSLRWIPTGKMFTDSTTKVDSEPPNGSNDDITNPYECNQTLYFSAGTSNQVQVICQSFEGKELRGLVTKKTDISYVRSSRNSNLMNMLQKMFGQNSSGLVLHLDDA
ncbi:hypothetical protein Tco_0858189 [Tanacetum coccineum]|uniref:Uncharacterized protein n=1 Tax=Tanacetum coccineum TaxID=301880 RepID=A0ABQ5BAL5_9ASTR